MAGRRPSVGRALLAQAWLHRAGRRLAGAAPRSRVPARHPAADPGPVPPRHRRAAVPAPRQTERLRRLDASVLCSVAPPPYPEPPHRGRRVRRPLPERLTRMSDFDLLLKGGRAVTPAGIVEADIGIKDGKIAAIRSEDHT